MRKFWTWAATFVLVVGGGIAVFWPVDHWRLYDANLKPLALTYAENYCSATIGMADGFKENSKQVANCMERTDKDNTRPSIASSPAWACQGVLEAGWGGSMNQCISLLDSNNLWFLVGGGITQEWNDAHPRPTPIQEGVLEPENTRDNRSEGVAPNLSNQQEDTGE